MMNSEFNIPRPGTGARVTTMGEVFAFSQRGGGEWKHPWQTQAFWNTRAQRWVAAMEPGFVNEQSPRWRTTIREQAAADRDFGTNPLTGQPFFSDPIFAREQRAAELRTIDVPMYLAPALPLSFRALGLDGDAQYPIPTFFRNLGVTDTPPVPSADDFGLEPAKALPRTWRLLRACDLWLHQPRVALTSTIALEPGIATGTSNVTQTLGIRSPAASDALRVFLGTFRPTNARPDPLDGDYEEPTFDELPIATVFLLSPLNAPLGSAPDGTWQPYVRHSLFWNLNYLQPGLHVLPGDPGVPFIPPLAAGAAQLVINFLTASLNDLTNQALNILNGHSLAGKFWTSTGGGHDAAAIETTPEPAPAGLGKAARNTARAQAVARARRSQRLDPVFPFRAEPFDSALLAA